MSLKNLLQKVKDSNFTIGIVGLGRVGLPLAATFATKGNEVIGYDVDIDRVSYTNKGYPPFSEEKLDEYLKRAINKGKLHATTNPKELGKCDIIIITVGTPVTKSLQPDHSQIYSALDDILKNDIRNKLIILRSTSTPTALEDIVKPYLEQNTGLKASIDFGLAVCPERIAGGRAIIEIEELPEIVGGIDKISSEITAEVFKRINPKKEIHFLSPKGAALAKLFTNVYRYVKFALANEFALIAEQYGEDAFDIIKKANANYVRTGIPIPGLVGGPCLTKDGYHLVSNSTSAGFVLTAWRTNEAIPAEIVSRLKKELEKKGKKMVGSKVGVLGLAYKAVNDDVRDSPSLRIVESLKSNGAEVYVYDPYVPKRHAKEFGVELNDLETTINETDALILATNHPDFKDLDKTIDENGNNKILMDCWGMFNPNGFKNIKYIGFGRGNSS